MAEKIRHNPLLLFALGFLLGGVGLYLKIPYATVLFLGLVALAVFFESPYVSVLCGVFGYIFLPDILTLLLLYGTFGLYVFRRFFRPSTPFVAAGHEAIAYVYFLFMIIQTVTSLLLFGSLRDFAIHTGGMFLMILVINEATEAESLHKLFSAVTVAATLLALIGIAQYVIGVDIQAEWVDTSSNAEIRARAYSLFGNPNIFAEYLVMVMPLTVATFWTTKRDGVRLLFVVMFLVQLAALFMTMSRGGWVGLAFAALVFVWIVRKELLLLAIPLSGIGMFFIPETFVSRFLTIFNFRDSSTSYRFKIWEITEELIRDHFLVGVGLGHQPFKLIFEQYIRTMPIFHAHNSYIEIFAELGVVGFVLFLLFMGSIFVNLIRYPLRSEDPYIRIFGAALTASFCGMLLHGMFENIFYMTKITTTFWLLLAFTYCLVRICKQRRASAYSEKRMISHGEQSFI